MAVEDCLTCKVVSTAGILGISGYLEYCARKAPQHSRFLRFSALTFVGVAGMNWWMRTTKERLEAAAAADKNIPK